MKAFRCRPCARPCDPSRLDEFNRGEGVDALLIANRGANLLIKLSLKADMPNTSAAIIPWSL
jgi:hypothetical protein